MGAIVITCAAADDITAWCLLAVVIAIVKAGTFESALYVIALAFLYVIVMLFIVKPFLKRVGDLYAKSENLSKPVVAIFFLTLILSSYATNIIGIHALFGAFMTGVIMPDISKFRTIFIEKVEDVSVILLLPLFFVFTGLRTEIGLINDPYMWKVTGFIILVAVVGKFFGSALAAKFVGQNWRDSLTIGALMNTRGLMELVVLNIGLDLKVITPEVFTMMVIMALVTTFMTGPALDIINWAFKTKDSFVPEEITSNSKYKILLFFGNNEKGKSLLRLASSLVKKQKENANITAMHMILSDEMHSYNMDEYETDSFLPIINESKILDQKISTVFKATVDIESDIVDIANQGEYDLLLVGLGKSIFEGTLLGKVLGFTTKEFYIISVTPDGTESKVYSGTWQNHSEFIASGPVKGTTSGTAGTTGSTGATGSTVSVTTTAVSNTGSTNTGAQLSSGVPVTSTKVTKTSLEEPYKLGSSSVLNVKPAISLNTTGGFSKGNATVKESSKGISNQANTINIAALADTIAGKESQGIAVQNVVNYYFTPGSPGADLFKGIKPSQFLTAALQIHPKSENGDFDPTYIKYCNALGFPITDNPGAQDIKRK